MKVIVFTRPDGGVSVCNPAPNRIRELQDEGAFAPHEQSTPDMSVRLEAGAVFDGVTLTEKNAQSTVIIVKPVSQPRIDRVVIDQSGAVAVITGTEAASPTAPAITAGKAPVAQIALTTSTTTIVNADITDERNFQILGAVGMTEDQAIASIQTKSMPSDATNIEVMENTLLPTSREFRDAWEKPPVGAPDIAMVKARPIHAERMAAARSAEIVRLTIEEAKQRLKNDTTKADAHAATITRLESLNLGTLATQITAAANPTDLSAVWPTDVRRPK